MIIAHRDENTAFGTRACHICMTKYIARAVNAWPFTVPKAKHPVELTLAAQLGLLTAP